MEMQKLNAENMRENNWKIVIQQMMDICKTMIMPTFPAFDGICRIHFNLRTPPLNINEKPHSEG